MPCKDSEITAGSAVRSVLNALRQKDELLIYDDGSTDSTLEIISSIKDKRVKVFKGEKSIGPGPASNLLVAQSQNELIARFDSDDLALPNRFSESLRIEAKENYDFVFSNMILFGKGWMIPQPPRSFTGMELKNNLVTGNQLNNSSMLGRRDTFIRFGGYGSGVDEDKALWLRLALEDVPMKLFRRYTVLYRVHPGQYSQRDKLRSNEVIAMEEKLSAVLQLSRHKKSY
jgi:glycosyltransferase involved in cell wall biosynthesis